VKPPSVCIIFENTQQISIIYIFCINFISFRKNFTCIRTNHIWILHETSVNLTDFVTETHGTRMNISKKYTKSYSYLQLTFKTFLIQQLFNWIRGKIFLNSCNGNNFARYIVMFAITEWQLASIGCFFFFSVGENAGI
jgi:hypothetical protein